jgi:hypothetical protein
VRRTRALTVTEEATVGEWAMVVDAVSTPPVAIAIGHEHSNDPAVGAEGAEFIGRAAGGAGSADRAEDADAVAAPMVELLGDGPAPSSLVMVVAADTDRARFATLSEAAELAGLPAPTWVPDAVARVGAVLAALQPDRPRLVVDVRRDDPEVWGVRPTAAAGRIGTVEPVDVVPRVEALLVGMLRAKLQAAAPDRPDLVASLGEPDDTDGPAGRRTAAHLRRDLRRAARRLADTGQPDDAEIVVDVEGVEVTVGAAELAQLVAHASRDGVHTVLGPDAIGVVAVLVADTEGGIVRHLAHALGAMTVVPGRSAAGLEGAAALVRARPVAPSIPAQGPIADAPPAAAAPVSRSGGRPRWAVPALSSLVAAAMLGSAGVLAVGAMTPLAALPAAVAPAVFPVAPVTAVPVVDPAPAAAAVAPVAPAAPAPVDPRAVVPATQQPPRPAPRPTVRPRATTPRVATPRVTPRRTATAPRPKTTAPRATGTGQTRLSR